MSSQISDTCAPGVKELGADVVNETSGYQRSISCHDCVGACKQGTICNSFWPSDSLENEILEQEVSF